MFEGYKPQCHDIGNYEKNSKIDNYVNNWVSTLFISMAGDSIDSHLNHHYKHIIENNIITFKLLLPLQDV